MRRILCWAIFAGFALASIHPAVGQQPPSPEWPSAVARYYARSKACWTRYRERRLKTFTEATDCEDGGLIDSLASADYPHMDLVRVIVAEHSVIAERVDKRKITVVEGMAARAELESRMVAEIQRRDLAAQKMRVEAAQAYVRAQAQAQADARAQATAEAQGRMLEQMQSQAAADAEAARRAQDLELAGRLLGPQFAAPRMYPSQTTCQRLGFQLVCNSN
jgi:hypothetical protein